MTTKHDIQQLAKVARRLETERNKLAEALENSIGRMESASDDLYSAGCPDTAGRVDDQVDESRALLDKIYGDAI